MRLPSPRVVRPRTGPVVAVCGLALALTLGPTTAHAVARPTGEVSPTPSASGQPSVPVGGAALTGHRVLVTYGPEASPLPQVGAAAWVLADAETGELLAAKAPHVQRPPASTLKTLTALTLIPRLDPDDTYTATWADVSVVGSRAGLVDGGRYQVEDLFFGLMLPSGNDAARALAHANGGVARTVGQMNEVAQRLQAFDTVAKTPHGLDTPDQVSSAYDLALIARSALHLEDFRRYVGTLRHPFPAGKPKGEDKPPKTFALWNQNPLIQQGYRGAIGVKTGYTTLAGRTFVGAAERGGRTLVVTLMGIQAPTGSAAGSLLTWGFRNADRVTPVGSLVDPLPPDADPAPAPPGGSVGAAPAVASAPAAALTSATPIPWTTAGGVALVLSGLAVAGWSVRRRREDARGRQRMIAAARRAR